LLLSNPRGEYLGLYFYFFERCQFATLSANV
jgi:hypothetical protein